MARCSRGKVPSRRLPPPLVDHLHPPCREAMTAVTYLCDTGPFLDKPGPLDDHIRWQALGIEQSLHHLTGSLHRDGMCYKTMPLDSTAATTLKETAKHITPISVHFPEQCRRWAIDVHVMLCITEV